MKELLSEEFASKLERLAKEKAEEYKNAKPFPHIYFDNFLPVEAAEAALREFPEPKQLKWQSFENENEVKLAFDAVEKLPAADRDVLYFLNSRPMLQFLETLCLSNTKLTDAAVPALSKLKDLETIHLVGTGLTADGVKKLQEALPGLEIKSDVN